MPGNILAALAAMDPRYAVFGAQQPVPDPSSQGLLPGAAANPMPSNGFMPQPQPSSPLPAMAQAGAPALNLNQQPQGFAAIQPPSPPAAPAPAAAASDDEGASSPIKSGLALGSALAGKPPMDIRPPAQGGPGLPAAPAQPGFMDNLSKVLGGLYGAGGPGDALINLGVGMSSGPGGMQRALQMTQSQQQSQSSQQLQQLQIAMQQAKLARDQQSAQGGAEYVQAMYKKQGIDLSHDQAVALAANSGVMSTIASNTIKDTSTAPKWQVIGEDQYGNKQYGFPPAAPSASDGSTTPAVVQPPTSAAPSGTSDLMGLHGTDFLGKLTQTDPAIAGQVQAIVEGRAPYPSGMLLKTPYGQKLSTYVTQTDPTFEAGNSAARMKVRNEFEAGGPSSPAGMITAGNTAIQHLGHLSDAAAALGNADSGIPGNNLYNSAKNTYAQSAGGGTAVTQFNNILGKYVEEATKFYRGSGGTEADIQRDIGNLSPNMSPTQLHAAIQTQVNLLQSKINALQDRWRQGMGPLVPDFPIVQPDSASVLKTINQRAGGSPAQASAPASPASPAASSDMLSQARDALARGAPRDAVIQRLKGMNIDPGSL